VKSRSIGLLDYVTYDLWGIGSLRMDSASARAELARRVLNILAKGDRVSFHDAVQLRNWAIRPEESILSLAEIAHRILEQEDPNAPEE
jgi:hypothetical protein